MSCANCLMAGVIPSPDYKALKKFLSFFCPETKMDMGLILSMMLTSVWGGSLGQRPAYVIISPHGRGVGKSTLAYKIAHLLGQTAMDGRTKENMETFKTRLLSATGVKIRMVVFDNETGRVDCDTLAQLVTGKVISGRRLYEGEGQRPNNIIWIITLNTTHLTGDLATRAIPISLIRPSQYVGAESRTVWEQQIDHLIEEHRWGIISALIDILKQPINTPEVSIRWSQWAVEILAKVTLCAKGLTYKQMEALIVSRQKDCDSDDDEVNLIDDKFREFVRSKNHNPDVGVYYISNADAATIYQEATGSKCLHNTALRALKDLKRLGQLNILEKRVSRPDARGMLWSAGKFTADASYLRTDNGVFVNDNAIATTITTKKEYGDGNLWEDAV